MSILFGVLTDPSRPSRSPFVVPVSPSVRTAAPNPFAAGGWVDGLGVARVRLTWLAGGPVRFRQRPADTLWAALGAQAHDADPARYRALFKTAEGDGGAPSPFVLAPALSYLGDAEAGDELAFELTLVGWAADELPFFAALARGLEATGLGAARDRGCGAVRFLRAEALDAWGRATPLGVGEGPPVVAASSLVDACAALPADSLSLRFLSPVYLKAGGELAPPSGGLLLRRLGWRVRELVRLHGGGTPPDFRPLLGAGVRSTFHDGSRVGGHRFSASQRREGGAGEVPTGGYVGTLALAGALGPLLPLLVVGQWLHVGKNAERGYGRYRIVPPASLLSI